MMKMNKTIWKYWDWWITELGAMMPKGPVNWLLGCPRIHRVAIVDDIRTTANVAIGEIALSQLSDKDAFKAAQRFRSGAFISAVLPSSAVLTRRSELPAAARNDARQIIELEIARSTPFQKNDVFWNFEINERSGDYVSVTQYIVKARFVEKLRDSLAAAGLQLTEILAQSTTGNIPVEISALGLASHKRSRFWAWANGSLIGAALFFSGVLLGYPYFQDLQELKAVSQRSQSLRAQALTLRTEANERQVAFDRAEAMDSSLLNRTSAIHDIGYLTNALPDNVWLSDLVYRDRTWTFSGYSSSSSAQLVLDLSRDSQVADAKLTGPVSISSGDSAERFEAALRFVGKNQ